MTSKWIIKSLVLAVAIFCIPALGLTQNAGFRVGIAQPQSTFTVPPAQAQVFVPKSTWFVVPPAVVPQPWPQFQVPAVIVPQSPVIVPQYVLGPGQTFVQPPIPLVQAPAFHLRPGMPRSEVIRQYGAPSVTIITSAGETLYFTGGVTVIIQNGQVSGPR